MRRYYRVTRPEQAQALNSCGLLWQAYRGGPKEPSTIPHGRVLSWWEKEIEYRSQYVAYYKLLEY